MLTPKAQYSLGDARKYFAEHLSIGDYYREGQTVAGQWHGRGAETLGLSGVTGAEEFLRLCENQHPRTGEQLTPRQNTTRKEAGTDGLEHDRANRRVFYDFTFSPPKSVSIAALVAGDSRIIEAHEQAVVVALRELETFAATRIRKQGQSTDRTTGNLVAAVFRHDTSRALDPHLHCHCVVFNATHDPEEGRWKALQNHDMMAAQKFVENVYYHELARDLRGFGYGLENKARGDFEIRGISRSLIDTFSKRHQEIDRKTRELLEREPDKAGDNIAAIREHIAHRDRARKIKNIGLSRLQTLWAGQMTKDEAVSLGNLIGTPKTTLSGASDTAEKAVVWAEEHLFDRKAVVQEHELWRHALEHARGENVRVADLRAATKRRSYVRDGKHPGEVTVREVLRREEEMVWMARNGIGRFHSLCWDYKCTNSELDTEQRQAAEDILRSSGFLTIFRGGAGTGKSRTLREIAAGLRLGERSVIVLAPQRQQVMDLERDGFLGAQTVSAFLGGGPLPERTVVIVDEAGQIGGKQMHALLSRLVDHNARVILSGDTRQHGAVEASDALRAIERYSGVRTVELSTVRRQNPALGKTREERRRIKEYRRAVIEARDGKLAASFNRLDKLGVITACAFDELPEKLAARYLEHVRSRRSTVVVSQTWSEIHKVNDAIRRTLKLARLIGEADALVTAFQPMDRTDAQKRDLRSYEADSVLVFNRPAHGFKVGQSARLLAVTETHLLVEGDQRAASIPFKHLERLTVCRKSELALSNGDRLQLKANGRSAEGRKLANGELVAVKTVATDGRIALTDGRTLGPDFRQFVRGYALTSYAAQGKTVDQVLFADSTVKAATSDQQWYVTISRGRKGIDIFTSDKQQLRENITRSGQRPLATELAGRSPFFKMMAGRFGLRAAEVMERGRMFRLHRETRKRVERHRAAEVRPSRNVSQSVGM